MAKKIRFPLEMKDGAQVRTMGELKENWDIEKMICHYHDGRLATWLSDRYLEDEAAKVAALDGNDSELARKLSEIFGVAYEADEITQEDMETMRERQEKLNKLRQYTDDKNILDHIDHVAFDTEEILDAIDAGAETIYLVNNEFEIPLQVKNKQYVGVGKAIAKIASEKAVDFEALGIRFENVQFDEKYAEFIRQKNYEKRLGEKTEERHKRFLLGKRASRDIVSETGAIIVKEGEEITSVVLEKAKMTNKFIELSMNIH